MGKTQHNLTLNAKISEVG